MSSQAANATAIRTPGHKVRASLSVFEWGAPVLVAELTATPKNPTFNFAISVVSGSASNVKPGMLYTVENAGGYVTGRGTIRYAGTISSVNLPVRELSYAQAPAFTGYVVRVYRYFELVPKIPTATSTFDPDGLAYTDQNANPAPVANDYGAWAGDTSMLPIAVSNTNSFIVDPDSVSAPTVARTLPSGLSYASGNSTSTAATITGSAGTYWNETAVTDPDNGKTLTKYTPFRIHDDDDPAFNCLMPSAPAMSNGRWAVTVDILDEITYDSVPEGAWAAVYVKETIAGVRQSFGHTTGREHMKLFGIIRRRSGGGGGTGRHVTSVEIVSPLTWWEENPNFSKVMQSDETPSVWSEIKSLNTKRAALQIPRVYTNWNECGLDIRFASNYRVMSYPAYFIQKLSAPDQVREIADGVGAKVVCLRDGCLYFYTRLSLLSLTDRSGEVTTFPLAVDDLIEYEYELEDRDTLEKLSFRGFTAGSSPEPMVFSWPGKAPGTGSQAPILEKMIFDDILEGAKEAGRRAGIIERIFVDSNGQRRRSPKVKVVLWGSFDFFDALGEWVTLPDIPGMKQTDIDLSAFRYEIENISVEYPGDGRARVTLELWGETNAAPGQYDPPPTEAPVSPPGSGLNFDFDFDEPWDVTVDAPVIEFTGQDLGVTGMLVGHAGGGVAIALDNNGLPLSPTFSDISTGLTGSAGYGLQVDPKNFSRFYGAFSDGLWMCPNVYTGAGWAQILDNSRLDSMSHYYHQVLMSPYCEGLIIALAGLNHADVSRDYGRTWTTYNLSNGADARTSSIAGGDESRAEISWHDSGTGRIWVGLVIGGNGSRFVRWDGYFTTATVITVTGYTLGVEPARVFVPFLRADGTPNYPNSAQEIVIQMGFADSTLPGAVSGGSLLKSANAGSSLTTVLDAFSVTWAGRDEPGSRMMSDVDNAGGVFNFLERKTDNVSAIADQRFVYTNDNFVNIIEPAFQPTWNIGPAFFASIAGYPSNPNWAAVYGYNTTTGLLQVTIDRGATAWIDAVGNLAALFGDTRIRYVQPA